VRSRRTHSEFPRCHKLYLLHQETRLSASRSFGTVFAERLLDLIALLLLFIPAAIISLHESLPPQLLTGLKITLAAAIAGITHELRNEVVRRFSGGK
jgi:hypothetical protein